MLPNNIDLNLLQVFDAVYGAGSVSVAAEALKVSQPAVSGALARLREIVGDPLFIRHKGGVIPTARADAMSRPIREALNRLIEAMYEHDRFDPATSKGEFRMTMVDIVEPVVGAQLGRTITAEAPGVQVQFVPVTSSDFLSDLYSGRTHAAIQYFPTTAPHVRAHPLFRIDLCCITRIGWQDRHGPLDRDAFERARHATLNQTLRSYIPIDRLLASQGSQRRITCEMSGLWSIASVVGETDLIAVVPRIFAERMGDVFGLASHPCPFDFPDEVGFLLWHERNHGDPLQRWLRSVIIDSVKGTAYAAAGIDDPPGEPIR